MSRPMIAAKKSMAFWLTLSFLPFLASNALADSIYRCRMNAKATRDFAYGDKASWCGSVSNCDDKSAFETKVFPQPNFDDISYREYLISISEETQIVKIKSYWARGDDGKPLSEEFNANVISRDGFVVFFITKNQYGNKLHSYALDLKHKRLVATSVMNGLTSLVADAKTDDCE
jgi:hypothetical protein